METVDPDQLIRALAAGRFAMAPTRHADSVDWIEPRLRAVMPVDGFHLSGTLGQTLRSDRFAVTVDRAFGPIVASCAEVTPARIDTWISAAIEAACAALHRRGLAHSIERWRDGALVGGLYGIGIGGFFSVESMFSRVSDASKIAFAYTMARLRAGGYRLVDCQFPTPHLASLGAVAIDRQEYRRRLAEALAAGGVDPAAPLAPPAASAVDFFALDRLAARDGAERPGRLISSLLTRPPGNAS